jgi:molybdopterin biosynthesis enzyme MoaB
LVAKAAGTRADIAGVAARERIFALTGSESGIALLVDEQIAVVVDTVATDFSGARFEREDARR